VNKTSRGIVCILSLLIATLGFAQSTDRVGGRANEHFHPYAQGGRGVRLANGQNRPDLGDHTEYGRSSGKLGYDANPIQPEIESTLENLTNASLASSEAMPREAKTDTAPDYRRGAQHTASLAHFEVAPAEDRSRIRQNLGWPGASEAQAHPNSGDFGYDATSELAIRVGEISPKADRLGRGRHSERESLAPAAANNATASFTAIGSQDHPKRKDLSYYHPPPTPEPFNVVDLLARMTIGTVTVLGVGVVGLLTARRWLPQSVQGGKGGKMKLEESLALGKRCCVHLVSVENRKLVVVMDGGGVKSVETLNEPFADIASWDSENQEATNVPKQAE